MRTIRAVLLEWDLGFTIGAPPVQANTPDVHVQGQIQGAPDHNRFVVVTKVTNGNGCPSDQPSGGAAVNSTGQRLVGEFAVTILPMSCAMRVDVVPIFLQMATGRGMVITTIMTWAKTRKVVC